MSNLYQTRGVKAMNSKLRDILMDFDTWCLCGKDECALSQNFKEAEKAIRQAVGEEMLGLVGDNEYGNIGYDGEEMVNETTEEMLYRNQLRAELRQKIKQWQGGEDEH